MLRFCRSPRLPCAYERMIDSPPPDAAMRRHPPVGTNHTAPNSGASSSTPGETVGRLETIIAPWTGHEPIEALVTGRNKDVRNPSHPGIVLFKTGKPTQEMGRPDGQAIW
jgi:hypothetical protein